MSLQVLKKLGLVIATHESTVELPIRYVLHQPTQSETGAFKISIYQDFWLGGALEERDANSDIPICVWYPDGRGCISITSRFLLYRDSRLVPHIESICQQMYEAWKEGEDG